MHSITHSFVGLCILLLAFETIDLNFMHLFFFFFKFGGGRGVVKGQKFADIPLSIHL